MTTYKAYLLTAKGTVLQIWWDNVSICCVYYDKSNLDYGLVNTDFSPECENIH